MKPLDELAAELADELHQKTVQLRGTDQFWIGLAGSPGSGKSTLAAALKTRLKDSLVVIPLDGYHYSRSELDKTENPVEAHARRGAPFTFNATRFLNDLIAARRSGKGSFPSFAHHTGDPIENKIQLTSAHRIVLVEGNYLLLSTDPWCRLRDEVFDETWFIDLPIEESNRRVMERHMTVGLNEDQARLRVETNDALNARLILKESPGNADRIIRIS